MVWYHTILGSMVPPGTGTSTGVPVPTAVPHVCFVKIIHMFLRQLVQNFLNGPCFRMETNPLYGIVKIDAASSTFLRR